MRQMKNGSNPNVDSIAFSWGHQTLLWCLFGPLPCASIMRVSRLMENAGGSDEQKQRAPHNATPVKLSLSSHVLNRIRTQPTATSTLRGAKACFHQTVKCTSKTFFFRDSCLLYSLDCSFITTDTFRLPSVRGIPPTLRPSFFFLSPLVLLFLFTSDAVYTGGAGVLPCPKTFSSERKGVLSNPPFDRPDPEYQLAKNTNGCRPGRLVHGAQVSNGCSHDWASPQTSTGTESTSGLLTSTTTTSTRSFFASQPDINGTTSVSTAEMEERTETIAWPREISLNESQVHIDSLDSVLPPPSASEAVRLEGLGYILGPPYTWGGKPQARHEETRRQESEFSFTGQQSPQPEEVSVKTFANHVLDMGFRSSRNRDEEDQETEYQQWQGEFDQGKNNREFQSFTDSPSSREEPASEGIRTQRKQTRVSNGGNASENRMKKSSFTVEFAFGSPPSSAPSPPQLLYLLPIVDSENRYVHLLPTITHMGPFLVVPSGVDTQLGSIPSGASGTAQETGGSFPELLSQVESSIVAPVARPQRETFQTQPSAIDGSAASNHGTPGVERSANQVGIPFSGFLLPSSLTSALSIPALNELQPVHSYRESQFRNTGVTGETTDRRDSRLIFHLPPLSSIFGTSLPSSMLHNGGQNVHHLSKTSSYAPTPQQLITLPTVATIISPADVSREVALPPLHFSGPSSSSLLSGISAEAQEDTLTNTLSAPPPEIVSSGMPLATVSEPSGIAQDIPESPSEPSFLTGQETPSAGVTSLSNASALDYMRGPPTRAVGFFGTGDSSTGSLRQTLHLTPTETGTAFPVDKYGKYQDSGGLDFVGSNAGDELEAMTPGQLVELALNHASEAAAQATDRENPVMSSISTLLFPHQQDTDTANSQAGSRGSWAATQRVLPQLGSLFSILTGLDRDLLWRFFTGPARPPSPTVETAASVPAPTLSSPEVNFLSTSRPADDHPFSKQWRSHEYDPTAFLPMPNVTLNPSPDSTASRTHARNALQSSVPPLEALKFGLHVEVPDVAGDGGLQSQRV